MIYLLIIVMLITAAIAGFFAGLLGIGGGLLIVPVLFNILGWMGYDDDIAYKVAIATSLATIIVTGLRATQRHNKKKALDIPLLKKWGGWIVLGAALGALVTRYLSVIYLLAVFICIALYAAYHLWKKEKQVTESPLPKNMIYYQILPFFIGFVSTFMGIGGGSISTPVLTGYGKPIHKAIGTASAIGFLIAIVGTLGLMIAGSGVSGRPPFSIGYVNILAWFCLVPVTAIVAPIGANIAHHVPALILRRIFSIFLILSACRMLYKLSLVVFI